MNEFHKEILSEVVGNWTVEQIENYIIQLEQRRLEMDDLIKHLRAIRKKKTRKAPLDTGVRGGA